LADGGLRFADMSFFWLLGVCMIRFLASPFLNLNIFEKQPKKIIHIEQYERFFQGLFKNSRRRRFEKSLMFSADRNLLKQEFCNNFPNAHMQPQHPATTSSILHSTAVDCSNE
jgi:hypothetical protein